MAKKIYQAVVFGGGISGLATAHWLKKKGLNIKLLEASSKAGGSIITGYDSGYVMDFGPNSGLNTHPKILELIKENGLEKELIFSKPSANKRYILKNGDLHPLPLNPSAFLLSKLFSTKGKLRILKEPFIGRSKDGYYQSLSEFVTRRLGKEFLDYAINPFVAGIFAGDPDKLSVKSSFPKLYKLEEEYGGLLKGMIKGAKERKKRAETSKQSAKMFSFKQGMGALPSAIAGQLKNEIIYEATVTSCKPISGGYAVLYNDPEGEKEIYADHVISTIPAYHASGLFEETDKGLKEHFKSIYYPPVMVLFLGYKKEKIGRSLDGFGFLIPELEKKSFLGALWNTAIFHDRADAGNIAFTLFVGGARSPHLLDQPHELLIEQVLMEFNQIMNITEQPDFIKSKLWQKAIPQYQLGYIEHEKYFEEVERKNPGLHLSGNYRGGISLSDCIKNAWELAEKIS